MREIGKGEYGTHLPVLMAAIRETSGNIIELGSGDFSTPIIHETIKNTGRKIYTYDNNGDWLNNFIDLQNDYHILTLIEDWNELSLPAADLIFIDHAPAEQRQIDIEKYSDSKIMVVHDTEKAKYYKYNFSMFKYKKQYERYTKKTTILSNYIDVTKLI